MKPGTILEREVRPGLWEQMLEVVTSKDLSDRGLRHRGGGRVSNSQAYYPKEKFRLVKNDEAEIIEVKHAR